MKDKIDKFRRRMQDAYGKTAVKYCAVVVISLTVLALFLLLIFNWLSNN